MRCIKLAVAFPQYFRTAVPHIAFLEMHLSPLPDTMTSTKGFMLATLSALALLELTFALPELSLSMRPRRIAGASNGVSRRQDNTIVAGLRNDLTAVFVNSAFHSQNACEPLIDMDM